MKLSTLLSPFVFVLAAKAAFGQSDPCLASASDARDSCRLSAQSGYSLALATCANESDPAKQATCRQNAQTALQDALAVCDAQFSARQTICGFLGGRGWDPEINPADFLDPTNIPIDKLNPYNPLKPGTTLVYQAHTAAGGLKENRVAFTHNTKTILGVTCLEVHDTVSVNGQLTEDTLDWFAQDKAGNVWYFGEDSEELSGGRVTSLEGSWMAGVDGAVPGIIMEANPKVGDAYRQELLFGVAEDFARVLSLDENVKVPVGTFDHCLETTETSGLEPGASEFKFYAPGVGVVFDNDVSGKQKDTLVAVLSSP